MKFSIKTIPSIIITFYRLNIFNVFRVVVYRIQCRIGYFQYFFPVEHKKAIGHFFDGVIIEKINDIDSTRYIAQAEKLLKGEQVFFFHLHQPCGSPPVWLYNPFSQKTWVDQSSHWSKSKYFSVPGEDIKVIWELSRFYWAPQLACAYRLCQNEIYLNTLNNWVMDWTIKNPVNQGVQWLCAQEASIRMINILMANLILGNNALSSAAQEFVIHHCKRIAPTMHYARAQQNNHATSEAAALFMGGVFLLKSACLNKQQRVQVKQWTNKGRKALEKSVSQLVMNDGSFSQYSITYHRLMLDSLSLSIYVQRLFELPEFSGTFLKKYELAFAWLYDFTDKNSFNAPNFGSNDGTLLFDISLVSYRNFRPSLQLASTLLYSQLCFPKDGFCDILKWLNLTVSDVKVFKESSREYLDGGFIKFASKYSWALLRLPVYRFRPSQCDGMHFDLWVKGVNVLCDSGTYSYNPPLTQTYDFSGVAAHNTIQIDQHDQMNKLSRFLYMGWTKGKVIASLEESDAQISWHGCYLDAWGAVHKRKVTCIDNRWEIEDIIENFKKDIVLRWHLANIAWSFNENACHSALCDIAIFSQESEVMLTLEQAEISPSYLTTILSPCLVAKISAHHCGTASFKTIISILE